MKDTKYFTSERNVQILISLLKEFNINKVIASPGATIVTFIGSIQHDPYFKIYSCIDERSAAYMACGLSAETGEPVVLACTGATASRNYMPGLTEAFYRKLPIIAVTGSMESNRFGQLWAQYTYRANPPLDVVKHSFNAKIIKDEEDEWQCTRVLNEALLELFHDGRGPIHINLETRGSQDFSIKEILKCRVIKRFEKDDEFPKLNGKIAIFIGSHLPFNLDTQKSIEEFCEKYNAVVFCDQTSNYNGKYKIQSALLASQENLDPVIFNVDILIHIGEISGDYYTLGTLKPNYTWRVNEDGTIRDRFRCLSCVFEMSEYDFFNYYNSQKNDLSNVDFYKELEISNCEIRKDIENLPFSNIWIASQISKRIPSSSTVFLSILNTLRAWNFFEINGDITVYANVGGFGIDGMTSTLVGASLVNPKKLYFGFTGDLNFFYDINVLGNRHISNNLRLMLINNGHGQEFRNYKHNASILGEEVELYIAAKGHNGKESKTLVKDYAEDLGYIYLSASNKDEFNANIQRFLTQEHLTKPIIFEVFTESDEESSALKDIRNIVKPMNKILGRFVSVQK